MCIVGKTKELAVLQVETVEALAETVGELLAVLDRVKGSGSYCARRCLAAGQ